MADDGGIGRLQRRFRSIPAAVRDAAQVSVKAQAEAMAETMRALVPVDTGATRESIAVTPGGQATPAYSQPGGSMTVPQNAAAVTVGDGEVRTAHLVEYGTTIAPAKPFFWPAVRMHNRKAKMAIKSAISRAVRKEWSE